LGLGFTFFSGATEAWLVDALNATGFRGSLESVMARGQVVGGAAMLAGSVAGGGIAQATNLGMPYVIRSVCLGLTLVAAFFLMKDIGFTPDRSKGPLEEVRRVSRATLDNGWRNPPVRWLMLAALFFGGVDMFAFYALQPYLLELYRDPKAFGIAGLAAAIVAGTEMLAGFVVPLVRRLFRRRTTALLAMSLAGIASLALIGVTRSFPLAILLLVVWGLTFSATVPIRQAYLNGIIPSGQRATVLSFDSLLGSSGAVGVQPLLGKVADAWSYPVSYVCAAAI
jgi:MFS family permease